VLLGREQIRGWASLVVLTMVNRDHPDELVRQGLIRARFCELLAPHFELEDRTEDLFLTGMFSPIDVILGRPMNEVLDPLPIDDDVKRVLTCGGGPLGSAFRFVQNYERAAWSSLPPASEPCDRGQLPRRASVGRVVLEGGRSRSLTGVAPSVARALSRVSPEASDRPGPQKRGNRLTAAPVRAIKMLAF
jgi:hypothetical protein